MAWAENHKQQTRLKILDSAARLFTRSGFERVGIDEVMQEAGLTRGAFYAHFASKAALYAQAIPHAAQRAQAALVEQVPEPANRQALVDGYLSTTHRSGTDTGCPLAFLTSDISQREPEVRAAYTQVFRSFIDQFSNSPGQRERAIRTSVLLIGGMAIARALDDESLVQELFAACRRPEHR